MKTAKEINPINGPLAGKVILIGTEVDYITRQGYRAKLHFLDGSTLGLLAYKVQDYVSGAPDEFHNWPRRLTLKEWLDSVSAGSFEEWASDHPDVIMDSVVPSFCSEGCEVEPDGICQHGHPSVLRGLGII